MIYFLRMRGTTYVKIGYTSRDEIEFRLNELQTGCPRRLEIAALIDGDESIESDLHRQAWQYRTDGGQEWFDLSAEVINKLLEGQSGKQSYSSAIGGTSPYDVRPVRGGQYDPAADDGKDVSDARTAFDHARYQPFFPPMR